MALDPASERPVSDARRSRVIVPFVVVTLIWGSTWLVIRDGLGVVPPSWSVTYRFIVGSAVMFAWAAGSRQTLRLGRQGQLFAILIGVAQFVLNFNCVYHAEQFVTSGLVALVFALLIVPNALFAALFLRQGVSRPFVAGSAVAMAGIALLFAHELRISPAGPQAVAKGIGFTLLGVLSASASNVMQAGERVRALPIASLIAWAMLWGTIGDGAFAWATAGPPVFDPGPAYWLGVVYLGLVASALAFPLYFSVIRVIGPARAAYSSVIVPIIAMGLSTMLEGYRWSFQAGAGAALTLVGLVVALSARRPAR